MDPYVWLFMIISLVMIFLIVIFFISIISNEPVTVTSTPSVGVFPNVNLNSNFGESTDGIVFNNNAINYTDSPSSRLKPTTQWNSITGDSICQYPFFGPSCDYEALSNLYYDIGTLSPGQTSVFIMTGPTADPSQTPIINLPSLDVNRLSFPYLYSNLSAKATEQKICTDICNGTTGCIGVYFNEQLGATGYGVLTPDNRCALIKSPIFVNNYDNIPFSSSSQGNLFLKKGSTNIPYANVPNFSDRVFVIQGSQIPIRYWTQNIIKSNGFNSVAMLVTNPATIYSSNNGLDFFPTNNIPGPYPNNFGGLFSQNILPTDVNQINQLIVKYTATPDPNYRVFTNSAQVSLSNTGWKLPIYGVFVIINK